MKRRNSTSMWKGLMFAMLWTLSLGLFAQNITVRGTVTDANNEPVIGATVIVSGDATRGTVTDIDGNFKVSVAPGSTLVISYIGYDTQRVKVADNLHIVLRWVLIIIFFEILIPPEPFMRDAPHFFYRKYNKNLL